MKLGVIIGAKPVTSPGVPVKKYRLQRLGFPTNDINKPGGDCSWVGGVDLSYIQNGLISINTWHFTGGKIHPFSIKIPSSNCFIFHCQPVVGFLGSGATLVKLPPLRTPSTPLLKR